MQGALQGLFESQSNTSDQSFEEYSNTSSYFESYENAFLRMVGMPSSSKDVIDEYEDLFVINTAGNLDEASRERYMSILKERQNGATQSTRWTPELLFSMTEELDPYQMLQALGFNKVTELSEILDNLRQIFALNDMQSGAANDIADTFKNNLYNAEGEVNDDLSDEYSALLREKYSEIINMFLTRLGPQQEDAEPVGTGLDETSPPPATFSYVLPIIEAILQVIDPNVFPNISAEIKRLLTNLVLGIQDPSFADLNESANFWRFSRLLFPPIQV